jgi:hypothetical protein
MVQPPPAWLDTLVDVVVDCMEAHSPTGPVGFRYLTEHARGELVVYLTPVELVGGADDGAVVVPGFALGLQALVAVFDQVTALQWCPHGFGPYDLDGPCVSLEGVYQGYHVWLRVLRSAKNSSRCTCRPRTACRQGGEKARRCSAASTSHSKTVCGETGAWYRVFGRLELPAGYRYRTLQCICVGPGRFPCSAGRLTTPGWRRWPGEAKVGAPDHLEPRQQLRRKGAGARDRDDFFQVL